MPRSQPQRAVALAAVVVEAVASRLATVINERGVAITSANWNQAIRSDELPVAHGVSRESIDEAMRTVLDR